MNFLSLYNFKVFNKVEEFQLAPITFLTGKNNSGKSSLLKSILILSDYLANDNDQLHLNFNGYFAGKHKINCFGNAKTWNSKEKLFSIEFVHDNYKFKFSFTAENIDTIAILKYFSIESLEINEKLSFEWLSESSYELILSQKFFDFVARRPYMNLFDENELIKQVDEIKGQLKKLQKTRDTSGMDKSQMIDLLSEEQRLKTRLNLLKKQIKYDNGENEEVRGIYKIVVSVNNEDEGSLSLASIIRKALAKYFDPGSTGVLNNEFRTLFKFYDILRMRLNLLAEHLSPNRFFQSRLYFKQNYVSEINEVLFRYAIDKPKPSSEASRFIEYWLQEFGLGEKLLVDIIEGNSCKVEIVKKGKPINIADMGFGPGQLLTTLLCLADIINKKTAFKRNQRPHVGRNNIVLIEEPEANLHPMFQSKLLDLFYEVHTKYKLTLIIETHSEYLIRRSQVKVKELGKDHPFRVYYFDSEQGPFEMKYREDGIFENDFGTGFFDESANLTFELL